MRVPGNPETEVSLEQPGPPLHDEATAAQLRELVTKGAMGGLVFITDDARGLYETLKARGVTDFTQEPTDHFYGTDMGIRDPFGNAIRILQQGEGPPEGDGLTTGPRARALEACRARREADRLAPSPRFGPRTVSFRPMTRMLLRSPKTPFQAVSADRMLTDSLMGGNSGNLIFLESAYKLMGTRGTEITLDRFAPDKIGRRRHQRAVRRLRHPVRQRLPIDVRRAARPLHQRDREAEDPGRRPERRLPGQAALRVGRVAPDR